MAKSSSAQIHWLSEKGIIIKFPNKYFSGSDPYMEPPEPVVNKLKRLFKEL